jgi:hypothetical protein
MGWNRVFGEFHAKNTVHTPDIHGSGQPFAYQLLCATRSESVFKVCSLLLPACPSRTHSLPRIQVDHRFLELKACGILTLSAL